VTITEPAWIVRTPGSGQITIDTALAGLEPATTVRAVWRDGDSHGIVTLQQSPTPTQWTMAEIPNNAEILIQIDGRWIWRWLP
jgi:hypothetical protein